MSPILKKYKSLNEFIAKMNKNAPLNTEQISLKYPYKPFLILAILTTYKHTGKTIFNNCIKLWDGEDGEKIAKQYYDYIASDDILYDAIIKQKGKQYWNIGWNAKLYKSIVSNIIEAPSSHFECEIFTFDKKNKSITLKLDYDNQDYQPIIDFLKKECIKTIKKCLPYYKKFDENEIEEIISNYYENILSIETIKKSSQKYRTYQHLFAKKVKDRDGGKCIICCSKLNSILEACHIKWDKDCQFNEAFDINNGITLCRNHHRLFDVGDFTFNLDGTVKISKFFKDEDFDLQFKQYEKCYLNSKNIFNKKYLEYHWNNIYKG